MRCVCVLEIGDFKEDSEALTLGRVSPQNLGSSLTGGRVGEWHSGPRQ